MNFVDFKYQFSEKEYVKAFIYFAFRRLSTKIVLIIFLFAGISHPIISYYDHSLDLSSFWILFCLPFIVFGFYSAAKKIYRSSERFSSEIYNSFDDEYYKVSGKDFKSEVRISSFFKVEKHKNWIFIFTSKRQAIFLKTEDVTPEINAVLKKIFDHNNIKNNL